MTSHIYETLRSFQNDLSWVTVMLTHFLWSIHYTAQLITGWSPWGRGPHSPLSPQILSYSFQLVHPTSRTFCRNGKCPGSMKYYFGLEIFKDVLEARCKVKRGNNFCFLVLFLTFLSMGSGDSSCLLQPFCLSWVLQSIMGHSHVWGTPTQHQSR